MTEIDCKDNSVIPGTPSFLHPATPVRERRKFVSFTVELLREGGPLGNYERGLCIFNNNVKYMFYTSFKCIYINKREHLFRFNTCHRR